MGDRDSLQSLQAFHAGKDPSRQLQLLCKQHQREGEERPGKGKGVGRGRRGRTILPFPPSTFQGAAVLGNWTSQPERDQTRVISSVINSGSHLFCALIYLQTIQSPKALLTTVDSQERALGGGALRAGFHPWCVALDRCTNHTADIAWSPQLQFLASMQLTKGKRKAFSKNTQETRSFHYNSQPAMPRPLSSDNPLLLKFLWALLIA